MAIVEMVGHTTFNTRNRRVVRKHQWKSDPDTLRNRYIYISTTTVMNILMYTLYFYSIGRSKISIIEFQFVTANQTNLWESTCPASGYLFNLFAEWQLCPWHPLLVRGRPNDRGFEFATSWMSPHSRCGWNSSQIQVAKMLTGFLNRTVGQKG